MKYLDVDGNVLYNTKKMELVFDGKLRNRVTGGKDRWKVWKSKRKLCGKTIACALAYHKKYGAVLVRPYEIQELLGGHYSEGAAKKAYDSIFGEPDHIDDPASCADGKD